MVKAPMIYAMVWMIFKIEGYSVLDYIFDSGHGFQGLFDTGIKLCDW